MKPMNLLHFMECAIGKTGVGILFVTALALSSCSTSSGGTRWYKGNTHTHTSESDGDSEPAVVAQWYKDRGYDFLVLTDHNKLTAPDTVGVADDNFLLIPGEELTTSFKSAGAKSKPIHINGLDIPGEIAPVQDQASVVQTIQKNIDAIRAAGGLPSINHPNFHWAISNLDLLQVENCNLLEIYNGHPQVNNNGNDEVPGMEAVWDILLTQGKRIHGIAVDDAHHFKAFGPEKSNPGKGWVMVPAERLEVASIREKLEEGDFYFTTGALIDEIRWDGKVLRLDLPPSEVVRTVTFIGRDGRLLAESTKNSAVYRSSPQDMYVRAKVQLADGTSAWTQPFYPGEAVP